MRVIGQYSTCGHFKGQVQSHQGHVTPRWTCLVIGFFIKITISFQIIELWPKIYFWQVTQNRNKTAVKTKPIFKKWNQPTQPYTISTTASTHLTCLLTTESTDCCCARSMLQSSEVRHYQSYNNGQNETNKIDD